MRAIYGTRIICSITNVFISSKSCLSNSHTVRFIFALVCYLNMCSCHCCFVFWLYIEGPMTGKPVTWMSVLYDIYQYICSICHAFILFVTVKITLRLYILIHMFHLSCFYTFHLFFVTVKITLRLYILINISDIIHVLIIQEMTRPCLRWL